MLSTVRALLSCVTPVTIRLPPNVVNLSPSTVRVPFNVVFFVTSRDSNVDPSAVKVPTSVVPAVRPPMIVSPLTVRPFFMVAREPTFKVPLKETSPATSCPTVVLPTVTVRLPVIAVFSALISFNVDRPVALRVATFALASTSRLPNFVNAFGTLRVLFRVVPACT